MHLRFPISAAVLLFSIAAHATPYTYTFSYPQNSEHFTLTTPDLITTDNGIYNTTTCSYLGAACDQVGIDPFHGYMGFPTVYFLKGGNVGTTLIGGFPSDFFTTVGLHAYGGVTMDIEQVVPAPTPEPSSIALLGTGLLGITGVVRKRFGCYRPR
jgi:hypothetical protein